MAFMPLVYVGSSEKEAREGAIELTWYLKAKAEPQFRNPPGYVPVDYNVRAMKNAAAAQASRSDGMRALSLDQIQEQGVLIYGTPDQVIQQINRQYARVGGFDHLLMMMQAGFLDHKRTVANIELFAKEVYPAIRHLPSTVNVAGIAAAE